ncbi:MAG: NADH-quinone oxidoreductase subunit D, partial [Spirochaetota bacterium]|nr:NADH-quinone oxidoreductase subunit D [Spirochaetota bacterium]
HIICVGLQGMDLGAFSVFLWTFVEREKLYDIFEAVTGARLTTSYTRVGGLAFDVPSDFEGRVTEVLKTVEPCIAEIEKMLTGNRIFRDRCEGIGVVKREDALNYGITGPMLRASGVAYDIRKIRPYLTYAEYDFTVPVETTGDSFARYLIRLEEMRQSVKIIKQALKDLPDGSVNHFDNKKILPDKDLVYNNMEALIHHFKVVMPGDSHGINPPVEELYSSTETPNGELGFHIVSDGSSNPYRLRVRPPSLINYQIISEILPGHFIADIPAILSTFNVIAGELDR